MIWSRQQHRYVVLKNYVPAPSSRKVHPLQQSSHGRLLRHLLLHELVAAAVAVRSAGAEEVPVAADGLLGAGVGGDARRSGGAVQSAGGGRGRGTPAGPAPEAAARPAGELGVRVLREMVEEHLEHAAAGVVGGCQRTPSGCASARTRRAHGGGAGGCSWSGARGERRPMME